ncbi:hypothetical protein CO059_00650 [candidate division WWE3 bacterium CG_4_9_14_0_2_um_filter_48_10]|uniref:Uncharacterized protein n=1 Tax=candidate division WWE3 bacterium CG_4_9_14_0_2_um_filter_48_10 TaxID=1975078 RepID=A0A2M8EK31_UNCKA|nr:MAG: hypothetical protein CO059_00650 [candidate division WWE3 bacterium CG_4_9_14_0_2_um_filter_48_10]
MGLLAVFFHLHFFGAAEETLEVIPRFETLGAKVKPILEVKLGRTAGVTEKDNLITRNATMFGTNEIKPLPFRPGILFFAGLRREPSSAPKILFPR